MSKRSVTWKCQKSGNALGLSWDWPTGIASAWDLLWP